MFPIDVPKKRINDKHVYPLLGTRYTYLGIDNEDFTYGDSYIVFHYGEHWMANNTFVFWMTNKSHPNTCDEDFGTCLSFHQFYRFFEKV